MARHTRTLYVLLALFSVSACGRPTAEDIVDNQRQSLDDNGSDPPPNDPPPNDPPANDPPANSPPANDPPANSPPANDPPANSPPANDPPANSPPANDPPANNAPASNAPANNAPASDDPASGDPASDDPGAAGSSGDGTMMLASADGTSGGTGDDAASASVGVGLSRDNGNTIPQTNGTVVTNDEGTWVQGSMSTFGGPSDTGVSRTETGALTGERLRSLDPNDYYVAMRFDYGSDPDAAKASLADDLVVMRNPDTGDEVVARAVDWGPSAGTGRVIDMSPGSASGLGLTTDSQVQVQWAAPGTPLGPRHRSHGSPFGHGAHHVIGSACNVGGSSAPLLPGSLSVAVALLFFRRRESRR